MLALYKKEVFGFLSSVVGYLTILIFLLAISVFMWIIPGEDNVFMAKSASLDFLFRNGPVVFLFLIPAITMKTFAEERRTGTIELLLTKPLSTSAIILSKFLGSATIILFALLPTLIYYYSIYQLGQFDTAEINAQNGNIDFGGTVGSYFGLFLVGCTFASIGVFSSVLTKNQVIAFLLAFLLCFVMYQGFSLFGNYALFGTLDAFIMKLGIDYHYTAMQKGVLDSRDIIYFTSIIVVFLLGTQLILKNRSW